MRSDISPNEVVRKITPVLLLAALIMATFFFIDTNLSELPVETGGSPPSDALWSQRTLDVFIQIILIFAGTLLVIHFHGGLKIKW